MGIKTPRHKLATFHTCREIIYYYDHYLVESKNAYTNLAPKKDFVTSRKSVL